MRRSVNSSEVRAENALRLLNVTKILGERTVLDGLNLSVHRGEIYGLVGDNGAGKTTTIRLISGLMEPSSGHIEILGVRSNRLRGRRQELGVTIEEPRFYPWLTGLENLRLLSNLVVPHIADRQLDAAGELVGLAALTLRRRVREYSQGMRQRLLHPRSRRA